MKAFYIFIILGFVAGCRTAPDVPSPVADNAPLDHMNDALHSIARDQNPDGSWGHDEANRVLLSSIACSAFLAHGELPWSPQFGRHVQRSLRYLLAAPADVPTTSHSPIDPAIALTWTLCQANALTHISEISNRVAQLMDSVPHDRGIDSPIELWMARFQTTTDAKAIYNRVISRKGDSLKTLLDQACVALAVRALDDSYCWYKAYDEEIAHLLMLRPQAWMTGDYPMLTVVALCDAFAEADKGSSARWWEGFWIQFALVHDAFGSIPAEHLEGRESKELSTFADERDKVIYAKCMMVLAGSQAYRFRMCRTCCGE